MNQKTREDCSGLLWSRRLIGVVMVVSCLESTNKGLVRKEALSGLVALKMKAGW